MNHKGLFYRIYRDEWLMARALPYRVVGDNSAELASGAAADNQKGRVALHRIGQTGAECLQRSRPDI